MKLLLAFAAGFIAGFGAAIMALEVLLDVSPGDPRRVPDMGQRR